MGKYDDGGYLTTGDIIDMKGVDVESYSFDMDVIGE